MNIGFNVSDKKYQKTHLILLVLFSLFRGNLTFHIYSKVLNIMINIL
ncbi:DUF1836 domain-containing protein [Sulfolobus acidocaldarius DSM 639]|nr:DUF1836 domain-containing protein [Sulfolobus acidocaldarius DSM 639]